MSYREGFDTYDEWFHAGPHGREALRQYETEQPPEQEEIPHGLEPE